MTNAAHHLVMQVIASSKYMGLLPSSLGSLDVVNWIPVDYLSEIVLEMAGVVGQQHVHQMQQPQPATTSKRSSSSEVTIYHAVNPHNVDWADLVPTVADQLTIDPSNIVSWNQWVEALRLSGQAKKHQESGGCGGGGGGDEREVRKEEEEGAKTTEQTRLLEKNPGIKLLDFFGSLGDVNGKNGSSAPLLATEVSAARSKTLASLQPVGAEWMSLWVKQMGFA